MTYNYPEAATASAGYSYMLPPKFKATSIHDNNTLVKQYLRWKQTNTKTAYKSYKVWVKRFQAHVNCAPEEITLDHWVSFVESLEGNYAPFTITYAMLIARNYLRYWKEVGRLNNLPLKLIKIRKGRTTSHLSVTEEELILLIEHLERKENIRDLLLVRLLADTGMRVGELASLEIDQLEEDQSAMIQTEKTIENRYVYWSDQTDEVLQEYLVNRINEGADTDFLFPSGKGGKGKSHLSTRAIQRVIGLACKEAGVKRHITPHSFRHAFIHKLALEGYPDSIIATLVGHGSPHTVSNYTKLTRKEFEQAARQKFKLAY